MEDQTWPPPPAMEVGKYRGQRFNSYIVLINPIRLYDIYKGFELDLLALRTVSPYNTRYTYAMEIFV